ncbi:hypothetical protein GRI39_02030 [Altererythrobacter indicus]|uniref:Uncharacterized protein n=1 Tax=Altericroceibacterium indicum TaxID=374177 RepID=A0A845A7M8_9SPHN|nr:hypothetical protein [Altericroceibacterium indicum]MXP24825.1 hypothetical protein [Altericroceibacterium indicum]
MSDVRKSLAEHQRDERRRVKNLLERDRADRIREHDRKASELEVAEGKFVNLADTVTEPTPEWTAKGDVRPYTPRQPDGTVRSISTVRRVVTPMPVRLYRSGRITEDQARVCLWYRLLYDKACLGGRYSSSKMKDPSLSARARQGDSYGYMPTTMDEADARRTFRLLREQITSFYIRFFDVVVLDDASMKIAARYARCRNSRVAARFRQCAQQLVDFIEQNDIEIDIPMNNL